MSKDFVELKLKQKWHINVLLHSNNSVIQLVFEDTCDFKKVERIQRKYKKVKGAEIICWKYYSKFDAADVMDWAKVLARCLKIKEWGELELKYPKIAKRFKVWWANQPVEDFDESDCESTKLKKLWYCQQRYFIVDELSRVAGKEK